MRAIVLFLLLSASAYAMEGVYCEGKLYTVDYLSLENERPFYPQFTPDEIHPLIKRFPYSIVMNAMIQNFARELTTTYNSHLTAFLRSNGNIAWQRNDHGFPSKKVLGNSYNIPKRCLDKNGDIELLTITVQSKQGNLIAYEYDPKLVKDLEKDGLQLSYLLMGTYLRNYTQVQEALSSVNWFFHGANSVHYNPSEARSFLIDSGILKPRSTSNNCNLGNPLQQALIEILKIPCEDQIKEDIKSIEKIEIVASNREANNSILKNDFKDFSNLKELKLTGFGDSIYRISHQNYQFLKNLKSFTINDSYLNIMPQEMMYGLKNLTNLDLSGNDLYDFKVGTFEQMMVPLNQAPNKVSINLSNNPVLFKSNQYGFIAPGAFRGAEAVTHLNLSKMALKSIKSQVFDDFKRLTYLDISNNYIKKLKGMLNSPGLTTVTHLNMEGMAIRGVSRSEFNDLNSLKELKLSYTSIRTFPSFLLEIKTLKKLTFCSKHISSKKLEELKTALKQSHPGFELTICEISE